MAMSRCLLAEMMRIQVQVSGTKKRWKYIHKSQYRLMNKYQLYFLDVIFRHSFLFTPLCSIGPLQDCFNSPQVILATADSDRTWFYHVIFGRHDFWLLVVSSRATSSLCCLESFTEYGLEICFICFSMGFFFVELQNQMILRCLWLMDCWSSLRSALPIPSSSKQIRSCGLFDGGIPFYVVCQMKFRFMVPKALLKSTNSS